MIELTAEQSHAVRGKSPPLFVDPNTNESYVLLRSDLYERLTEFNDSPWTDDEMDLLAAEAGDLLDSFGLVT